MPKARIAPAEDSPHLEVKLACVGGATRLVRCASRAPLRVFRPVITGIARPNGLVEVPLLQLGGGLLPGESLAAVVRVGSGAAARFTGVGATHLHPPPADLGDRAAEVHLLLEVEPGGLAEWVPEPLVPHAGARYRQRTTVVLHPGAGLFLAECLVAGRCEEEAFSWDELALRTEIVTPDGSLLAVDALRFAPGSPPGPASFSRHRALAGVLAAADGAIVEGLAGALATLLAGQADGGGSGAAPSSVSAPAVTGDGGVLGGVSRLPGGAGLAVRLLAPGGGAAMAAVRTILAEWHRVWRATLTGRGGACQESGMLLSVARPRAAGRRWTRRAAGGGTAGAQGGQGAVGAAGAAVPQGGAGAGG